VDQFIDIVRRDVFEAAVADCENPPPPTKTAARAGQRRPAGAAESAELVPSRLP